MVAKCDFKGWATKNDLRCSDGRIIRKDAFKDDDGRRVPLVWQHVHDDPSNVIGHAILENREDGVYAYCSLNNTQKALDTKELIRHGDVCKLSIWANRLQESENGDVFHGVIREVSVVLAGANPGAKIEFPALAHFDGEPDEAMICTGENFELYHEDSDESMTGAEEAATKKEETKMAENKEKTVQDVFDSFTEEQKNVVYFLIGKALEEQGASDDNTAKHDDMEDDYVKTNVFDNDERAVGGELSHSEMETIFKDAKRLGSLKDSVLEHSDEYGIENISYLFPEDRALENAPTFIKRPDDWVSTFMNAVHHTPFSRIKSIFADITEEDARAKGYIKGTMKKEEFFSLIKRTTSPTTIYKKQKLDRDDIVDITDFDVVAWLKTEMRMMLNEEIARAALLGDNRSPASDDKINEQCIRPIWTDDDLFTDKVAVEDWDASSTADANCKAFIRAAVKARKNYRGSGNPTLYTTEDMLSDLLLMEDGMNRLMYKNVAELATALRVKDIVPVAVMENQARTSSTGDTMNLLGIIVNPADYNIGADKGGAVNMFDDFDIDYNQQKYLMETRCSGALTKPHSAIVLEYEAN